MNRHELKRHELKNGIAVEIWTEVHRVEKYKIGAAVQTLETIRFILFRDASLKDVSQIYATIHLRQVTHQYPWLVTGVFFHLF